MCGNCSKAGHQTKDYNGHQHGMSNWNGGWSHNSSNGWNPDWSHGWNNNWNNDNNWNNWNNGWNNNWNNNGGNYHYGHPYDYNWNSNLGHDDGYRHDGPIEWKDYGPNPFVLNIEEATRQNNAFRIALWTGNHLQLTLMSIPAGEDIGLEMHPELDQFIRIEEGQGLVRMGKSKDKLDFQRNVYDDYAFIIPAGTWHNLTNTGSKPLKLYSLYAPPEHPFGTVHETKADAMAAEEGEENPIHSR